MIIMRALYFWRVGAVLAALVIAALPVLVTGCDGSTPVEQFVAEAGALRDAGNFPAAIIKLKAALAQDPKSVPARLLSARIYIDLGKGDAALGLLMRAQQDAAGEREMAELRAEAALVAHRYDDVIKDTDDPLVGLSSAARASLLAFRGAALGALGREADARSAFAQGLALDPHSLEVRIASARLEIGRGDLDAARHQLGEATREFPNERRLIQLHGDLAYAARDYPRAEQIYQKILDAEPWNELARGDLAATQVAQDKLSEAIANLDAVLANPALADVPVDAMLRYIRAVAAFRQKDYAVAQSSAETVVTWVSRFAPARLIAGASSFALHEYERAYYYLSPYVSQNPADIRARKLLAATQLQLGRAGDATKTLSPVGDETPEDSDLVTLIGVAAARSGDMAAASRYLKLALDRRPDDGLLRTELGRVDVAAGDPKAGIDNLEQVVKAHPDAAGPQLPLFVAFMQTKEYDKALAVAEQVIKSLPNSPTGPLLASSVYLTQGNVEAGRAALLKAREIRHGDINANGNLAKLALADGKVDEARQYYQDILDANPQNTQTYFSLAELDARTGRLPEAEAVLLKGAQANPEVAPLTAALLKIQLAQGKGEEAAVAGQQALKKFPRNPELLAIVGRAQLKLGDRDGSLSTFRDLVRIAPQDARAHMGLAEAYLAQYTPENPQWPAINEATEAVTLDPRDVAAKLVLARALTMHGRFADAREIIDPLKTNDAPNIAVLQLDGLVARGQNRLADAAASFARAIALVDNAVDRRRLADTQLRLGRADDAANTLRGWLGTHPEDSETRRVLADLRLGAGQLAEATELYTSLLEREPNDAKIRNNVAWLLSRLGKREEALARAREALALAPASVDVQDTLGTILLQNGMAGEAVDQLDPAWQKEPNRRDIGFHLSQALAAAGRTNEALALLRRVLAGTEPFAERAPAQDLLRQLGG